MGKGERIGARKKREDRKTRIPDLGYYLIVTDTKETEKNYFEGIKRKIPSHLSDRIVVKVEKTSTVNLVERVFAQKTKKDYEKSDKNIYEKLCRYGDESKALQLAESKHQQCIRDGKKIPSLMMPCTTVYILVNEINKKLVE